MSESLRVLSDFNEMVEDGIGASKNYGLPVLHEAVQDAYKRRQEAGESGAVPLLAGRLFGALSLRVICAVSFGSQADAQYVNSKLKMMLGQEGADGTKTNRKFRAKRERAREDDDNDDDDDDDDDEDDEDDEDPYQKTKQLTETPSLVRTQQSLCSYPRARSSDLGHPRLDSGLARASATVQSHEALCHSRPSRLLPLVHQDLFGQRRRRQREKEFAQPTRRRVVSFQ